MWFAGVSTEQCEAHLSLREFAFVRFCLFPVTIGCYIVLFEYKLKTILSPPLSKRNVVISAWCEPVTWPCTLSMQLSALVTLLRNSLLSMYVQKIPHESIRTFKPCLRVFCFCILKFRWFNYWSFIVIFRLRVILGAAVNGPSWGSRVKKNNLLVWPLIPE